MSSMIQGYILCSVHEKDRTGNVELLKMNFPALRLEEAIYPSFQKVPFVGRIRELSLARTGHALNNGEIGCLLSHRRIWKRIAETEADDKTMFLVLESDSFVEDAAILCEHFEKAANDHDLFFWGAWEGHMKLFRSTKKRLTGKWKTGEPFIKSVYCTYGYSINKLAARHLLRNTKKVGYPVDQFKKFVQYGELRIGGVAPELISTVGRKNSYIQENRNSVKEFFNWLVLDARNAIICFFR